MPITAAPSAGQSQFLRNQVAKNNAQTGKSLERLSTGKRINRPSDDPAGFIAAEQLRGELIDIRAELKGYDNQRFSLSEQGSRLATLQEELIEVRAAVVEASDGLLSDDQRVALQEEIDAAFDTLGSLQATVDETLVTELSSGGEANLVNGDTSQAAVLVEAEQASVSRQRAAVGAQQQQLDVYEQIAQDKEVIVTEALSQIEDADFAEETANLATAQLLTQAAQTALVYSQQTHADMIGDLLDRVVTDFTEADAA